ncbi:hypothetical protein NL676_017523 [Syzygium grande]|nr:hypothetical protein NL676_017523 [Syzygium grande]
MCCFALGKTFINIDLKHELISLEPEEFVVNRTAEIPDLDFLACGFPAAGDKYELPVFLLHSSFLTELKLMSYKLNWHSIVAS